MGRVWLHLLGLLRTSDCPQGPGSKTMGQESFPRADGVRRLDSDYGNWKYYVFPASIGLILLIFITFSYFYSKYQRWRQLCACWNCHEVEEDFLDLPWETILIEYPEPYSICVTPPQSITGRSAHRSRPWDQVTEEDIRLPFAPKDLGRNICQESSFQTCQVIFNPGSLPETFGARAGMSSSFDDVFTIEDLE